MTLLEDFHKFFLDKGLLQGWQMFADGFKDAPDNAICIYEYANNNPHTAVTGNTRQLQIVVRAATSAVARAKAASLFAELHIPEDKIDLTPTRWVQLFVRNAPFKFKVDGQNRVYYAFNMACTTTIK